MFHIDTDVFLRFGDLEKHTQPETQDCSFNLYLKKYTEYLPKHTNAQNIVGFFRYLDLITRI